MEYVILGAGALLVVFLFVFPSWRRWEVERDRRRHPHKVPTGALLVPFDEVFHPAAYEANLAWEAEQEMPAPAPDSDGSRPDLGSGRIRIDLRA